MENNALLLEHVDTLEKENIALRHVHAKNLNDLAEATDRLQKLERLVNNLRVRNTEWAVKINDMKQRMNDLKLQRMTERVYKPMKIHE
jgi:phage shock protein A